MKKEFNPNWREHNKMKEELTNEQEDFILLRDEE